MIIQMTEVLGFQDLSFQFVITNEGKQIIKTTSEYINWYYGDNQFKKMVTI